MTNANILNIDQTAKDIRGAFRKNFGGTDGVEIVVSKKSGFEWIEVTYDNGPSLEEISELVKEEIGAWGHVVHITRWNGEYREYCQVSPIYY